MKSKMQGGENTSWEKYNTGIERFNTIEEKIHAFFDTIEACDYKKPDKIEIRDWGYYYGPRMFDVTLSLMYPEIECLIHGDVFVDDKGNLGDWNVSRHNIYRNVARFKWRDGGAFVVFHVNRGHSALETYGEYGGEVKDKYAPDNYYVDEGMHKYMLKKILKPGATAKTFAVNHADDIAKALAEMKEHVEMHERNEDLWS